MPSTNFPHGLSVTTAVHTTDGLIVGTTASISGAVTVGSLSVSGFGVAGNYAGIETIAITSGGTAHDTVIAAPFTGYIGGVAIMGITSARAASVVVYAGSATDGVALVTCTGSVAGAYSFVTAQGTTAATITWGSALCVTQAAMGSDGTFRISISFVKA